MRLLSRNIPGNVHDAVVEVNRLHAARHFISADFNGGHYTIVVLRFEDYPSYVYFCQRAGETPMSASEFFE